MEADRLMPPKIDLGKNVMSTMAAPMGQYREFMKSPHEMNPHGMRTAMGYCLPSWQREFVWTDEQQVKFIESAWLGLNLGTYTFNRTDMGSRLDNLLIDGQQRMTTIERYITDQFPVFGYRFSEITKADERRWSMTTIFASYITETEDEDYLRNYYDLMNFGGTAHKETERATTR